MGDTRNVKLGVCSIRFGGVDLGFTKGGVEVNVSTDTYKVTVDQFGESEVNELLTKRSVEVSAPLAESTLENMVAIMPGATLVDTGTKQEITVSETTVVDATEYVVTIDGVAYSYTTSGTDATAWANGLIAAINFSGQANMIAANVADNVVLTHKISGETAVVSVTGATASESETVAAVMGKKRVEVTSGIGVDLLSIAKELVIHPKSLPMEDQSEDLIIPLAATPGAMGFTYKTDAERIFNTTFMGYPDPASGVVYTFGDPTA